jgi:dTDP-4-amino-4,6-dideoxygalactose transaminase
MIPISRPLIGSEEEEAVLAVLRSGMIAQGPQVERFEAAFAKVCGASHAVAVSSGTTALQLALLAHGVGPGDEVITTPFSFIATANSVLMTGARPVFVDIDPDSFNIDPEQIEAAITPNTRAIIPVHLYGQIAAMDRIMEIASRYELAVIEDAAQAVGALYEDRPAGSFGTGCFSLYATKNITSGEGGMVTTSDSALADKLRLLRSHGSRVRYYHDMLGYNFRMTDVQAAIGLAQLGKLAIFSERRLQNATFFDRHITHPALTKPQVRPGLRHVYHQYTLRIRGGRDEALKQLAAAGVGTAVFYPLPIPRQPIYQELGYSDYLPVTDQICAEVLALPVHPGLSEADLHTIVDAVNGLDLG